VPSNFIEVIYYKEIVVYKEDKDVRELRQLIDMLTAKLVNFEKNLDPSTIQAEEFADQRYFLIQELMGMQKVLIQKFHAGERWVWAKD
jgi:hypothetical protein